MSVNPCQAAAPLRSCPCPGGPQRTWTSDAGSRAGVLGKWPLQWSCAERKCGLQDARRSSDVPPAHGLLGVRPLPGCPACPHHLFQPPVHPGAPAWPGPSQVTGPSSTEQLDSPRWVCCGGKDVPSVSRGGDARPPAARLTGQVGWSLSRALWLVSPVHRLWAPAWCPRCSPQRTQPCSD
jgi:hypothetical protein